MSKKKHFKKRKKKNLPSINGKIKQRKLFPYKWQKKEHLGKREKFSDISGYPFSGEKHWEGWHVKRAREA